MKHILRQLVKRIPLIGKPYVQRDELRAIVNQLWELPGHFYSPIPSLEEVKVYEERLFNANSRELGGIDLNEEEQLALLEKLKDYYEEQPFSDQKRSDVRYFFENGAFSYFDAIVLYCLLRFLRPKKVIEVGCGYSSCVFLDTNERFFDNSISLIFIEPHPELLNSLIRDEDRSRVTILKSRLQDVNLNIFRELEAGDILFIDSSHVLKTGSDVNHAFFEVLPVLHKGVYVHFRDVFYPFEYPREWVYQGRAWNEAYLLRAFLQYNDEFKVAMFNSFFEKFHRDFFVKHMPLCLRYSRHSMMPTSAQSIWLRKV